MKRARSFWGVAVVTSIIGSGCGAPAPAFPEPVPVSGTITMEGKPLEHAIVYFVPNAAELGPGATGVTGTDGKYTLSTSTGPDAKPGAAPGEYRVAVSSLIGPTGEIVAIQPNQPPADAGALESLPPRFSDPSQSELKANVGPTGGSFDFQVSRK